MKDIYFEPFLNSWPTPFSIKDIRECFKINRSKGEIKRAKKSIYFKIPEGSEVLNPLESGSSLVQNSN